MTRPAHTPGPWATNCSHIYAPDGQIIAQVHNPGSKERDYPLIANRDLIAAAPELLEAAQTVLEGLNARIDEAPMGQAPVFAGIAALSDAIAKAGGQS